jgi:hypothetical protein
MSATGRRRNATTRRRGEGARPDPDLAVALARLRAGFGEVQVLEVHPNPPGTASHSGQARRDPSRPATSQQRALALDTQTVEPAGEGWPIR